MHQGRNSEIKSRQQIRRQRAEGEAFVERQARRGLDAGEVGIGRLEAAPALGVRGLELFDDGGIAEHRAFARRARAVGDLGARESDRVGSQAVLGREGVDETDALLELFENG